MARTLQEIVDTAHARHHAAPGGRNASYIPSLAAVPSTLAGVAVATVDGQVAARGDVHYELAIESISKVCTLALVMEQLGPAAVRDKLGAEPTGLPFNSVIALELHRGRPLSPLVNAGAIATTSLVRANDEEERWQRILGFQRRLVGRSIALSDEIERSEQETNFHNRAIAWLLKSSGFIYSDPMEACRVYTRQCSSLITCTDLAMLGATLAHEGVHPTTGERVASAEAVPHVLAEMAMEGMYEHSGTWAYTVGLPGKSGVGGGIVAVMPGAGAIAGFSPPLDAAGNSVRGQRMVAEVARALGWNLFRPPR